MLSSFIALSTSVRLFRENLASGYGGREIRFALVNFTGLSLVTRSPARWSLAGIPEHRDAFEIVPGDLESSIADILGPRARFRFRFLTCVSHARRADHRCANCLVKLIDSARNLTSSFHGGDIIIVASFVNDK